MNETGKNIVKGFRELRQFCRQLSLFFITTNGLINAAGWKPIPKISITGNSSGRVDKWEKWLPTEFSQFYENSKYPHYLLFIAVLLDDLYNPGIQVNEALLTAGFVNYGPEMRKQWNQNYDICRSHLWMADREDHGRLCLEDNPQEEWEAGTNAINVATFAYPLTEITDCEMLEEKIVQRLLKEIMQESQTSKHSHVKA